MSLLRLSVVRPFEPPPPESRLVVFSDIAPFVPEEEAQELLRCARRYAKGSGVYLVPNRFAAEGYLGLCLISPQGEILGGQRATHLSLPFQETFSPALELNILDTPFGKLFLAVDADLLQPEVLRAAALAGAQLVIGSRHLDSFAYTAMEGLCATLCPAHSSGMFVLDVTSIAASVAAPTSDAQVGHQIWNCEAFPITLSLDPAQAPGFGAGLSSRFYRCCAKAVWGVEL